MAKVTIDKELCTDCSLCAQVCPNLVFEQVDRVIGVRSHAIENCISCGQCLAVCRTDAVSVEGMEGQVVPLPEVTVDADLFRAMSLRRRSVRTYRKREVECEVVEEAIALGACAPLSFAPWEIGVTTVLGEEKCARLAETISVVMEKLVDMNHHFISRFFIKRALGKERYRVMDEFFIPLLEEGMEVFHEQHVDVILRGAPALMVFHSSPAALEGGTDAVLAAAHTALALQSLGLGVCFNGLVTAAAKQEPEVREALGVPGGHEVEVAFTFGYPRVKYRKGITREFRSVDFV